jgi:redox-sensitive bicupin YhaK (pirin superfamily)
MANRPLIAPGHWADFDPFLVLMEDWMREPGGFPDHPHRGIETVTLVLDGELHHADNRGNSGVLGADDVQWMTAGKGIIHAELPHEDKSSHTLQLWLNLPSTSKMVDSDYQDLLAAHRVAVDDDRARICLISGELEGIRAPTRTHTPVQYLDVEVDAGGRAVVPVPAAHNGFVFCVGPGWRRTHRARRRGGRSGSGAVAGLPAARCDGRVQPGAPWRDTGAGPGRLRHTSARASRGLWPVRDEHRG